MSHPKSLFPNHSETDELELRYCDIELNGENVTITGIWRRATTELGDVPPAAVVEKGLQPGQALIVGDVLYAFVPPSPDSRARATTRPASADSEPSAASEPDTVEQPTEQFESNSSTSAKLSPVAEPERPPEPSLVESVELAERLTRLSLMLCEQQERYMKQHVERVRRFDEYVEERGRRLDVRGDKIAEAQERHLETLRSITEDVTASVRLVGSQQQFPATPQGLPADYLEARARLAASAAPPFDPKAVARTLGTLLDKANAFLSYSAARKGHAQ